MSFCILDWTVFYMQMVLYHLHIENSPIVFFAPLLHSGFAWIFWTKIQMLLVLQLFFSYGERRMVDCRNDFL